VYYLVQTIHNMQVYLVNQAHLTEQSQLYLHSFTDGMQGDQVHIFEQCDDMKLLRETIKELKDELSEMR